ncbi:MAG TPA: AAA family ATPase [Streptosporangiaceae bacterium]|nr:AAA family ATPase [Streptosporangiaceae bacterium]
MHRRRLHQDRPAVGQSRRSRWSPIASPPDANRAENSRRSSGRESRRRCRRRRDPPALGAVPRYLKAELITQASDLLAAEIAERHRRVVLIRDEAHLLAPARLEELRLLTNADMDSASPSAGLLAGQPTLNRQLRLGHAGDLRPA